ncbi:hypothetical protein D3C86_1362180 [compost metagenome]
MAACEAISSSTSVCSGVKPSPSRRFSRYSTPISVLWRDIGMQIAAHRAWAAKYGSSPNGLAPAAWPTMTGWPVRITVWNIDIGRSSAVGAACANCTRIPAGEVWARASMTGALPWRRISSPRCAAAYSSVMVISVSTSLSRRISSVSAREARITLSTSRIRLPLASTWAGPRAASNSSG